MQDRRPTIRSSLALLAFGSVIPALLIAVVLISYSYQRERDRLVRDSVATARAMVHAVDRDLSSVALAAEILGTSPALQGGDLPGFDAHARRAVRHQIGNNVVLSDASGQQLINTIRPLGDPLPRHGNPDQLRKVFETGRAVTSDLYIGGVVRRQVVSIDVPVMRDGSVAYDLSIGLFPERFTGLLTEQRLPPGWIAAIFDGTGTIVSRTHELDRFLGKKGAPALVGRMREVAEDALETTTLEGIPVLTVFSRSTESHWTVAIGIPLQELTGTLRRSLAWLILGVALVLLASLAMAWTIGGRISSSIHGLSGPALALGLGEAVTLPALHLKEADEVGQALTKASGMLRDAQARFRAIFQSAPIAIVMVDGAGSIVNANAEMQRIFGYGPDELPRRKIEVLLPESLRAGHASLRDGYFASPAERRMGAGRALRARRKDGTEFPVEIGLSPIHTADGPFVLAAVADVTERTRQTDELKQANQALERSNLELRQAEHRAYHDALTGLANRALFNDIVEHQLTVCTRSGTPLAMLYVDLDGFKAVNDTHGHAAGDTVLRATAERLKGAIRSSDLAARLGGDEFAVLLVDSDRAAAETVAGKLADSIAKPIQFGASVLGISASIGIATHPDDGTTSEELLRSADETMYRSKSSRRGATT